MDQKFALGTFSEAGKDFVGLVIDDRVVDISDLGRIVGLNAAALIGRDMLSLLGSWPVTLATLVAAVSDFDRFPVVWRPMADLVIRPPVDLPRQIFCTGANYRKHVVDLTIDAKVGPPGLEGDALRKWAEDMMDARAANGEPYVFIKLPSAVTGPNDAIVIPTKTAKADWELELGVVIGREARNVSRHDALDYIAGYMVVNDVTSRDRIARTDYPMIGTDWLASKSSPSYLPCGPWLVPACFVEDPQNLKLSLKLNGDIMQDETTADMMFDVARQIEYISHLAPLWPGDVIATGSPAGNGTHYNRFLQPGDVIDASITGLGAQRNICVAQEIAAHA